MWELRDRPPHFLSGGQKQRLAIAGALAVQPRALILDEATAMLDPAGRSAVLSLLDSLHLQGVTIVTITHEMDEAARAGRVVVLSHGRVAMDGAPLQVFGRAAEIRELGLDLPLVADLAFRLGLPPCLTVPDLAAQLQGRGWPVSGAPVASAAPSEGGAPCPAGPPVVQVTGLSHTYMRGTPFEVPALSDVNMTVAQCDVTGLVGQTGSGKSTLIQHFNGLLRPQTGDVVVNGDRWADPNLDVRRARRKVGLLFQQPEDQLFERYLGDDVAFGPRQWGMERPEVRSRVQAAMDAVGLPFLAFKDRLTNGLSGGERRRAAMAGVLALQPAVLVVDEPTAGLDPAGRRDVLAILRQQHADGVTVIMASHRMEDIAEPVRPGARAGERPGPCGRQRAARLGDVRRARAARIARLAAGRACHGPARRRASGAARRADRCRNRGEPGTGVMDDFELLRHITIGQYLPAGSLIHRLDPRAKILGLGLLLVAVALCPGLIALAAGARPCDRARRCWPACRSASR